MSQQHYQKVLAIGHNVDEHPRVEHCNDDLLALASLETNQKYDLIIINPTMDFLTLRQNLDKREGRAECTNFLLDQGYGRFQDYEIESLILQLGILTFHSLVITSITSTDLILFSKPYGQYPWNIGAEENPAIKHCAILGTQHNHPILSIKWEELVPLGKYIYSGSYLNTLYHLLVWNHTLPEKYGTRLWHEDIIIDKSLYRGFESALRKQINIICPIRNTLDADIALFGSSENTTNGFLVLPPPHDYIDTLNKLLSTDSLESEKGHIGDQTAPSSLTSKHILYSEEEPTIPDLADYVGDTPLEGTRLGKHDRLKEFLLEYDSLVATNSDLKSEGERYEFMRGDQKRSTSHDYKKIKERDEWERFYKIYDIVKIQHSTWNDEQIIQQIIALSTKPFTYTHEYHKVIINYRLYFEALIESKYRAEAIRKENKTSKSTK